MRSAETLRRAQRWAAGTRFSSTAAFSPMPDTSVQRTEVLDQPVGQLVGVPAGDGIVQQQLQHLMIRQTVGSLLQEALPLALAMPVVQSHVCSPLPASWGNYSMTAAG